MSPALRPFLRRYRLRPLRLVATSLLLGIVGYLLLAAPRQLGFALSLPAPDPVAARGPAAAPAQLVASGEYQGRTLALQVGRDGVVRAAVATGGAGLQLHRLGPDGTHTWVEGRVGGEPAAAAFFGPGSLAVWLDGPGAAPGRLAGFATLPEDLAGVRGPLSPSWTREPGLETATLEAMAGAVALIGAAGDGVPDTCIVYGPDGQVRWREELAGGIFTAWSAAVPAGGLTLGGAAMTAGGLQPFVRQLGPDLQQVLFSAAPADGPPLALASSGTGRFVAAVTPRYLGLWTSEGRRAWSRRLTGSRVAVLRVQNDGRLAFGSAGSTLVLDARGQVVRRWRTPSPGPAAQTGAGDHVLLSLPHGAVVLDSLGLRQAAAPWEGPTELAAIDPDAAWLVRAGGSRLVLYSLRQPPSAAP